MRQRPGGAGGVSQRRGVLAASLRPAGAPSSQQPWSGGALQQQQPLAALAHSCAAGGGSSLARRGRLSRQQPAAPPPRRRQRQRAADLVRGLAADDDEGGDSVADVAQAASSWWHSLASPYDKEIFLLAVPALFSVLLGAQGSGAAGGRVWRCERLPAATCACPIDQPVVHSFTRLFIPIAQTPSWAWSALPSLDPSWAPPRWPPWASARCAGTPAAVLQGGPRCTVWKGCAQAAGEAGGAACVCGLAPPWLLAGAHTSLPHLPPAHPSHPPSQPLSQPKPSNPNPLSQPN